MKLLIVNKNGKQAGLVKNKAPPVKTQLLIINVNFFFLLNQQCRTKKLFIL